jgi:hypothetical protein
MHQIRLTRGALLALVFLGREEVRATEQIEVSLRVNAGNFLDDVLDPNHCFN